MIRSKLIRTRALPDPGAFGPGAVLFHDRRLLRRVPGFSTWAGRFPARLSVRAGEGLKSLDDFPDLIASVARLTRGFSRRETQVVCAGGGTVGDVGGFIASILKRGVTLVHVPSTWLAAVDSAHGGKTGLNLDGAKNQVGTFYCADRVYLVKHLLDTAPAALVREGLSELVKMAFLDGGPWTEGLFTDHRQGGELIWKHLPPAIDAKWKVVAQDPEEHTGHRQILNLGHTLGHVLEAHHGLTHGRAVAQGLYFALEWSRQKVRLPARDLARYRQAVATHTGEEPLAGTLAGIPRKRFLSWLGRDKKSGSNTHVTFIFLRGAGRPVRRKVLLEAVADEAARQGWVR